MRLSVSMGSERSLQARELPLPTVRKVPLMTAENEKDFEVDEVDAEVSKEIWPPSVDSTELSASMTSIFPSLMEFSSPESRKSINIGFDFDAVEEEDLLYPEVCAPVSNIDNPEMPALALRMWVIRLVLCVIGLGLSIFFNFCQLVAQVI